MSPAAIAILFCICQVDKQKFDTSANVASPTFDNSETEWKFLLYIHTKGWIVSLENEDSEPLFPSPSFVIIHNLTRFT